LDIIVLRLPPEVSRSSAANLKFLATTSGKFWYGEQEKSGEIKWRLLLPGASEPRLAELNPPGL
jgi:hypothetical protein